MKEDNKKLNEEINKLNKEKEELKNKIEEDKKERKKEINEFKDGFNSFLKLIKEGRDFNKSVIMEENENNIIYQEIEKKTKKNKRT